MSPHIVISTQGSGLSQLVDERIIRKIDQLVNVGVKGGRGGGAYIIRVTNAYCGQRDKDHSTLDINITRLNKFVNLHQCYSFSVL